MMTARHRESGHPVESNFALEPLYLQAAREVSRGLNLAAPIPKLCTLVVAISFDAALLLEIVGASRLRVNLTT